MLAMYVAQSVFGSLEWEAGRENQIDGVSGNK